MKYPLKGIHFAISYRHTIGCVSLYNYCLSYISEGFEDVASYIAEYCRCRPLHSHLTPPPRRTPANIPINLIFPETRIIGQHFCRRLYGSIFIQICTVASKRRIFSSKIAFWPFRSFKVIQGRLFWYQSKAHI